MWPRVRRSWKAQALEEGLRRLGRGRLAEHGRLVKRHGAVFLRLGEPEHLNGRGARLDPLRIEPRWRGNCRRALQGRRGFRHLRIAKLAARGYDATSTYSATAEGSGIGW